MAYIVVVAPSAGDIQDDYGNRVEFTYADKDTAMKMIEQCVFDQHLAVMAFEENDSEEGE